MNKLILIGSIILLAGCSSFKKLPACDSPEVTSILKNAITESPAFKLLGVSNIEVKILARDLLQQEIRRFVEEV